METTDRFSKKCSQPARATAAKLLIVKTDSTRSNLANKDNACEVRRRLGSFTTSAKRSTCVWAGFRCWAWSALGGDVLAMGFRMSVFYGYAEQRVFNCYRG